MPTINLYSCSGELFRCCTTSLTLSYNEVRLLFEDLSPNIYKILDNTNTIYTKIDDLDYDTITIGTSLTIVFMNLDPMIIRIIKEFGSLAKTTEEYTDNEDIVIMSLKYNPHNLRHASDRIKNNKQIIEIAIKGSPYILEMVDDSFLEDDSLIELAVSHGDWSLRDTTPDRIKNNKKIVIASVAKSGYNLRYASLILKDDYDVVMTATAQNGLALEFASPRLRSIKEIVEIAKITQNCKTFDFLCKHYNPEIV